MASAAKRQKTQHVIHSGDGEISVLLANKDSENLDQELKIFMKWCDDVGFHLNQKVRVGKQGSCSNYGMVAVDDVTEGETLFTIPRDALLHPGNCSISDLLKHGESELDSSSGWVPLLLCLMHEYTKADSKWRPYLDLCPDYSQLDPPMFWDREMIHKELQGTVIPKLVDRDAENIHHEYHTVAVPFMKKNPQQFDLGLHTLELYRKMVAFVMAYSFTEPKRSTRNLQGDGGHDDNEEEEDDDDDDDNGDLTSVPMMVPVADILNHVAKNNARLQFGETRLSMVATRNIKKDEEVFNTYGELANWQLLQMYGFAEPYPENIYDTVDLPMTLLRDQSALVLDGDSAFVQAKWDFLQEEDAFDDSIVIGCDGIVNQWETYHALKILSMTSAEFEKYQASRVSDDDFEEEDDIVENLEELLSFDGLSELPTCWKQLLEGSARKHLGAYKNTLEEDLKLLKGCEDEPALGSRQRYALHVRIGQRKLLEKVVLSAKTKTGTELL